MGRLLGLGTVLLAVPAGTLFAVLGVTLIIQQWGQGSWVPIAVGVCFVVTAVCFAVLVASRLVQPGRWDGERRLQGELLMRPARRSQLRTQRLYEGWICVAEWSGWRRVDASGPVRLVRGDCEWALLVDARGRRFLVSIPVDDLPVPFWVVHHWESRGLRVPVEVLDGRPLDAGRAYPS